MASVPPSAIVWPRISIAGHGLVAVGVDDSFDTEADLQVTNSRFSALTGDPLLLVDSTGMFRNIASDRTMPLHQIDTQGLSRPQGDVDFDRSEALDRLLTAPSCGTEVSADIPF